MASCEYKGTYNCVFAEECKSCRLDFQSVLSLSLYSWSRFRCRWINLLSWTKKMMFLDVIWCQSSSKLVRAQLKARGNVCHVSPMMRCYKGWWGSITVMKNPRHLHRREREKEVEGGVAEVAEEEAACEDTGRWCLEFIILLSLLIYFHNSDATLYKIHCNCILFEIKCLRLFDIFNTVEVRFIRENVFIMLKVPHLVLCKNLQDLFCDSWEHYYSAWTTDMMKYFTKCVCKLLFPYHDASLSPELRSTRHGV